MFKIKFDDGVIFCPFLATVWNSQIIFFRRILRLIQQIKKIIWEKKSSSAGFHALPWSSTQWHNISKVQRETSTIENVGAATQCDSEVIVKGNFITKHQHWSPTSLVGFKFKFNVENERGKRKWAQGFVFCVCAHNFSVVSHYFCACMPGVFRIISVNICLVKFFPLQNVGEIQRAQLALRRRELIWKWMPATMEDVLVCCLVA